MSAFYYNVTISLDAIISVFLCELSGGFGMKYMWYKGTAVTQWLGYCATNRKVVGSIPADVNGIFY